MTSPVIRRDHRDGNQFVAADGAVYVRAIAPDDLVNLHVTVPSRLREKVRRVAESRGVDMRDVLVDLLDAMPPI